MSFSVIIPARYASTRLPGKPLLSLAGKPMIQWVYERAVASGAARVVVATDDERIVEAATDFGAEVCVTKASHQSGTERIAEVIEQLAIAEDEIIVNVQGDEPLIPVANISQVAALLQETPQTPMATLCTPIDSIEELQNPNAVKVLADASGHAIYFSRALLPYDRARFAGQQALSIAENQHFRHIGIYAYRAGFVNRYIGWQPSPIEQIESLEQLRVLWYGERIRVAQAAAVPPAGVDTEDDFNRVARLLEQQGS